MECNTLLKYLPGQVILLNIVHLLEESTCLNYNQVSPLVTVRNVRNLVLHY